MQPTGDDVAGLIARSSPAVRRRDAETLTALLRDISGREPQTWGSIIGFGSCHYRYPTGTEGDSGILSFAPEGRDHDLPPRRRGRPRGALDALGPHTTGVGCLYIKDLDQVDLDVLRGILERSRAWVESGGDARMHLTITS